MITITGTTPLTGPPAWAVLERQLFDLMDQSVYPFLEKYTHPDGSLIWEGNIAGSEDDLYESFLQLAPALSLGRRGPSFGIGSTTVERCHPAIDPNGAESQGIRPA